MTQIDGLKVILDDQTLDFLMEQERETIFHYFSENMFDILKGLEKIFHSQITPP